MNIAIRDAYGEALVALGKKNDRVVVLDADVGSSARSGVFGQAFPERHFNFGIAEFNMTAAAAGMAADGLIPFVNTFATFLSTRAADAVNNLIHHDNLNVKLCGAYAGISDSYDGASHHALFDVAFMRALNNMTIVAPCDAVETRKAVNAIAEYDGPVYLRLSRAVFPVITDERTPFVIGKGVVLAEGQDVLLVASGSTVCRALHAATILRRVGISAAVIDMHTVKPLDSDLLVRLAQGVKRVFAVEEHATRGGLGDAVLEALVETHVPVTVLGIDRVTESGGYEELIACYGLDGVSIAGRVRATINQSGEGV